MRRPFAQGSPIFTKVELRNGTTQTEIALSPTSHDDATGIDRFDSLASPASCADLASTGVRLVAVYADGSTDCYTTGNWDEFDALACF